MSLSAPRVRLSTCGRPRSLSLPATPSPCGCRRRTACSASGRSGTARRAAPGGASGRRRCQLDRPLDHQRAVRSRVTRGCASGRPRPARSRARESCRDRRSRSARWLLSQNGGLLRRAAAAQRDARVARDHRGRRRARSMSPRRWSGPLRVTRTWLTRREPRSRRRRAARSAARRSGSGAPPRRPRPRRPRSGSIHGPRPGSNTPGSPRDALGGVDAATLAPRHRICGVSNTCRRSSIRPPRGARSRPPRRAGGRTRQRVAPSGRRVRPAPSPGLRRRFVGPCPRDGAPMDLRRPRRDVAIIGGGIVGLATAHGARRAARGAAVVVLEARTELAAHQTGHNSGVIHSGLYYKPGSLKARNCASRAARRCYALLRRARHRRTSAAARWSWRRARGELPRLDELERRGAANGLAGLRAARRRRRSARSSRTPPASRRCACPRPASSTTRAVAEALRRASCARRRRRCATGARVARARGATAATSCSRPTRGRGALPRARQLRRAAVATAWRARAASSPACASSRSAASTTSSARERGTWCATSSTRCPIPRFPFLGVHFTRTDRRRRRGRPERGAGARARGLPRAQLLAARRAGDARATAASGAWRRATGAWASASCTRSLEQRRVRRARCSACCPSSRADDLTPGGRRRARAGGRSATARWWTTSPSSRPSASSTCSTPPSPAGHRLDRHRADRSAGPRTTARLGLAER